MRYFTNSEMQTFKDCRRKWWLGHYRRLRPKFGKKTGAAPLGTRVHQALAGWYVPDGQTPLDPRIRLEQVLAADRAVVASKLTLPSDQLGWMEEALTPELELKEFDKEADLARAMIEGYVQWISETGADADYRVLASEVPIEYEFAPGLSIAGKMDTIVERIHDGVRLDMDHKTGDFADLRRRLRQDEQRLLYEILKRAVFPAFRSDGAVVNMIRKVKRTAAAKPPFYDRADHMFTPTELESAWWKVMGVIRDIQEVERRLESGEQHHVVVYPRPNRDCHWKCEFFAVCSMLDDGSRAEDMLQSLYEEGDPMERYRQDVTNDV